MRVLIEDYRGWEIFFDTNKEEFYTVSNEYDKDSTKKSFASSKKFIDDYIKENSQFKPVFVQREPSVYSKGSVIKLIGLRKDNKFMYEDENGVKRQLSSYREGDYFLVNPENDKALEKFSELTDKLEKINSEIKEINKTIIKVSVKQIRDNILGTNNN